MVHHCHHHLFISFIIEEYTVSLGTVFVQICLGQNDNYEVNIEILDQTLTQRQTEILEIVALVDYGTYSNSHQHSSPFS